MILVASIIVWFLSYYPQSADNYRNTTAHYVNSYLGRLGESCEPVFRPLGLNWKAGVAAHSLGPSGRNRRQHARCALCRNGFGSTTRCSGLRNRHSWWKRGCGGKVLVSPDEAIASEHSTLSKRLITSGDFTAASALSRFCSSSALHPCVATVAAIGAEAAGWKWAALSLIYNSGLACGCGVGGLSPLGFGFGKMDTADRHRLDYRPCGARHRGPMVLSRPHRPQPQRMRRLRRNRMSLRNGLATNRKCKLPTDRKIRNRTHRKNIGKRRKNSPSDFFNFLKNILIFSALNPSNAFGPHELKLYGLFFGRADLCTPSHIHTESSHLGMQLGEIRIKGI